MVQFSGASNTEELPLVDQKALEAECVKRVAPQELQPSLRDAVRQWRS